MKNVQASLLATVALLLVPGQFPRNQATGQECCEVLTPASVIFGAPIPCGFFPFCFKKITIDTGTGACGAFDQGFTLEAPTPCNNDTNFHTVQTNTCGAGLFGFGFCLIKTLVIAQKRTTYCGAALCANSTSTPPPPPPGPSSSLQGVGSLDILALR